MKRFFVYTDPKNNNNKFWNITVNEDGTFQTENGRVGYKAQLNDIKRGNGSSLIADKLAKGYVEIFPIQPNTVVNKSASILTEFPDFIQPFINRLIQSNIHKIEGATTLKRNTDGLFATPLGIVTPESINRARNILAELSQIPYSDQYDKLLSQYLILIPKNLGMKYNAQSVFPSRESYQKELDILDALESSYHTAIARPVTEDQPQQKVFDVDIVPLDASSSIYVSLINEFNKTQHASHGYTNRKVCNIYSINMRFLKDFKDDNVMEVWHGTGESNLLSILKSSLQISPPSTAYIAGKMFGNGIYGAIDSSKSLGYTYGKWGGSSGESGWLFRCKFAMGNIYYPTTSITKIPSGYDSVWAKARSCGLRYDELIVYRNNRVQIQYLLEIR